MPCNVPFAIEHTKRNIIIVDAIDCSAVLIIEGFLTGAGTEKFRQVL